MKKFAKLAAVFAALVLALSCFVACSNGDDDSNPPQTSTWTTADGCTLTFGDGTYEFDAGDKIYKGTYTETASTDEDSTGTLKGDVVGNYTITGETMAVVITSPFVKTFTLNKGDSTVSKPDTPSESNGEDTENPGSDKDKPTVPDSNTPSDSDDDEPVDALEGLLMQETGGRGYYFHASKSKYYLTTFTTTEVNIPGYQNLTDVNGKKIFLHGSRWNAIYCF